MPNMRQFRRSASTIFSSYVDPLTNRGGLGLEFWVLSPPPPSPARVQYFKDTGDLVDSRRWLGSKKPGPETHPPPPSPSHILSQYRWQQSQAPHVTPPPRGARRDRQTDQNKTDHRAGI